MNERLPSAVRKDRRRAIERAREEASRRQPILDTLVAQMGMGDKRDGAWDRLLTSQVSRRNAPGMPGARVFPRSGGGGRNEERIANALRPRPASFAGMDYWPSGGTDAPRESRSPFRASFRRAGGGEAC